MTEDHVPPSRRRSTRVPLADRAYEELLLQVIRGRRPPGDWLNIHALSRELNLSATPIREALARLEPTGFVRRNPLRGYEVAPLLSPTEIQQLMDARLLFEPAFAAEAATSSTPAFLQQLVDTIESMEHAGDVTNAESLKESWLADESFHTLLSANTGNPFIHRAFTALGSQLQRFRFSGRAGRTHALEAAKEHREILEAIRRGDGVAAAELMRSHIESARQRTLADERAVHEAAEAAASSTPRRSAR
ncbi:GntR family transcriptional regulator [Microterricola gilva]|uniref:GntR family transcriptional regulator n=1 Tax=Microterricola gilva TaxID=393267 RepID=A0A4Q8AS67_9MICO|nr:GntR family transcriptional regulator [Microterricola gilva]RZU66849.1 GntR family transcriptional regulator [Microterricola gilva]